MALNLEALGLARKEEVEPYPCRVGIYGQVITPNWMWSLRSMVEAKDMADSEYSAAEGLAYGVCYLYQGSVLDTSLSSRTIQDIRQVIGSFTGKGGVTRPRTLSFVPGTVFLDDRGDTADVLTVKAHDTFYETSELLSFNSFISLHFPEFKTDAGFFPRVDLVTLRKGAGSHYADTLNAAALWQTVTFSSLYVELGNELFTEQI